MPFLFAKTIEHYYLYQLDHLQESHKTHWLVRHYLWFQDDLSLHLLEKYQKRYAGSSKKETIALYKKHLSAQPKGTKKQAISKRRKQRAKLLASDYPRLVKITTVLFKSIFADTVFNHNTRAQLPQVVTKQEILATRKKLFAHPDHIRTLSTPAINFLYLTEWAYGCKREHPKTYLELAKQYTETDFVLNTLYLLTHCIIGESRFYARKIRYNKETYHKMLLEIDKLLQQHFKELPLDIKTEALLCARLLNKPLTAEQMIQAEIKKSMKNKFYLTDQHNAFAKKAIKGLSGSEHRNILYVMAMNPLPKHLR